MSTTTLLVEIVIIGLFALVWLCLLFMQLNIFDLDTLIKSLNYLKEWPILSAFAGLAIVYQLGWLIKMFSHAIVDPATLNLIRKRLFVKENLDYLKVRTKVYQNASGYIQQELHVNRSVFRLSRSGIVNFGMLAGVTRLFTDIPKIISLIFLLICISCLVQFVSYTRTHYKRMVALYREMTAQSKQSAAPDRQQSVVFQRFYPPSRFGDFSKVCAPQCWRQVSSVVCAGHGT